MAKITLPPDTAQMVFEGAGLVLNGALPDVGPEGGHLTRWPQFSGSYPVAVAKNCLVCHTVLR